MTKSIFIEALKTTYSDSRLKCVKLIRDATKLGLKESKDLMDDYSPNFKAMYESLPKEQKNNIRKSKVEITINFIYQ